MSTINLSYWLTNVRLETGFLYEDRKVVGTKTNTYHLFIEEGEIRKITTDDPSLDDPYSKIDADHSLALPSFVEKHVHLDKTLLGDSWRAVTPASSLFERFEIEKNILQSLKTSTKERAKALIDVLLESGSTRIRTHADIYPEVGLKNLEDIQEALSEYNGKLSYEIAAFPQHGLLRSQSTELMRQAVQQGASLVGGVDPATVDGDMEVSLQTMMEIAVEENVDVDLHLHDRGEKGVATIKRLGELTKEAGWQGRVTISHAFALADMGGEKEEIAQMLSDTGISIITSVPLDAVMPPVNFLHEKGVPVAAASDNIFDAWSPFGSGDILERAGRLAEITDRVTEKQLAGTLGFITDGVTPLNKQGERIWPAVGDEASIVLVEASCSAEAIARRAKRKAVLYKGELVSGEI